MPYKFLRGTCSYCDLCCICDIALKAVFGRDGIFPFTPSKKFGEVNMRGYDERLTDQPRLKERMPLFSKTPSGMAVSSFKLM